MTTSAAGAACRRTDRRRRRPRSPRARASGAPDSGSDDRLAARPVRILALTTAGLWGWSSTCSGSWTRSASPAARRRAARRRWAAGRHRGASAGRSGAGSGGSTGRHRHLADDPAGHGTRWAIDRGRRRRAGGVAERGGGVCAAARCGCPDGSGAVPAECDPVPAGLRRLPAGAGWRGSGLRRCGVWPFRIRPGGTGRTRIGRCGIGRCGIGRCGIGRWGIGCHGTGHGDGWPERRRGGLRRRDRIRRPVAGGSDRDRAGAGWSGSWPAGSARELGPRGVPAAPRP